MAETESIDPRPSGTSLQVVPVRRNGQARVALIGEIDLANIDDVEATLTKIASRGSPLTLDLADLSYIDSQGVSMLFRLAKHVRLHDETLAVVNPRGLVRRVLELTDVRARMTITDDV
jgi:anti-sigma B factor antagonist